MKRDRAHAVVKEAEQDVLRTAAELLELEEQVELQQRRLVATREQLGWARINHRAAAVALRSAQKAAS